MFLVMFLQGLSIQCIFWGPEESAIHPRGLHPLNFILPAPPTQLAPFARRYHDLPDFCPSVHHTYACKCWNCVRFLCSSPAVPHCHRTPTKASRPTISMTSFTSALPGSQYSGGVGRNNAQKDCGGGEWLRLRPWPSWIRRAIYTKPGERLFRFVRNTDSCGRNVGLRRLIEGQGRVEGGYKRNWIDKEVKWKRQPENCSWGNGGWETALSSKRITFKSVCVVGYWITDLISNVLVLSPCFVWSTVTASALGSDPQYPQSCQSTEKPRV